MINSQTIESYKKSDFEKIMNLRIKITLKKSIKTKGSDQLENIFVGQIINLGLSGNTPHIPVDIDFLIENSNIKFTTNIFQIDNIEI